MKSRLVKVGCVILTVAVLAVMGAPLTGLAQQGDTINFIVGNWVPPVLESFFAKFEKATGMKVKYEAYGFRDLFETIEIRQEAKSKDIDAFFVDAPLVPSYAVRGFMKPLDKYFTDQEIREIWTRAGVEVGYYNDTFWAPPINNSSQVLFYNKDLFDKAGLAYPSVDVDKRWTWDQVTNAARKIANPDKGIWGFAFDQINRYYQLQPLPESAGGGSGVSEDGLSVKGYLTNEGWIKAFTFYYNLFEKWKVSPRGLTPEEVPELFGAGKMGMFVGGLWNIPDFVEAGVNFAVAPHPYFADGKPVTPTNSWHVGVWSYTQKPDAAAKLVRYLTMDPEVGIYWLEKHGQFPARRAALMHIMVDPKYATQPWVAYRIGAYEARNTAVVRARTPAYLEFEEIIADTFEDIRNGADPKESLTLAEYRIERAMERYR